MKLGRVVGSVVSSRKDEELVGLKFLLVRDVDLKMKAVGATVVAADSVGAGVGELILYASGSSARQTESTKNRPVDATIMAIVDLLDVEGKMVYRKDAE